MRSFAKLVLLLVAIHTAACSESGTGPTSDAAIPPDASAASGDAPLLGGDDAVDSGSSVKVLTYWQDVVPIVEKKCMGCHQTGGIAPFSMGTYAEIKKYAPLIAVDVSGGIMPPYYIRHDGLCGDFNDSMTLTKAEARTLTEWATGGAAEGTPGQVVVPPLPRLQGGTAYKTPLFAPVAQGTDIAQYDEYRCFLLNSGLSKDAFITGFEVTPGNEAIVHHMLAFAVDPQAKGDTGEPNSTIMQRLHDASPEREGWPCFGAAGDNVAVAGVPVEWAPGQGVVDYPAGMGFQMKSNYQIVIQVHYNLADPESAGQTDSSTVNVRYADAVDRRIVFFLPDGFLDTLRSGKPDSLPAGKAETTYSWSRSGAQLGIPAGLPFVDLVGVGPHMHTRGIGQKLEIGGVDASVSCAAELTRWDFHWQRFYFYKPEGYPRLLQSSRIDVTCTYDTTAESAPVLPGWGTRNEMCLMVLMAALPPGA